MQTINPSVANAAMQRAGQKWGEHDTHILQKHWDLWGERVDAGLRKTFLLQQVLEILEH